MVGYPPQGIVPRGVREETASYVVFKVGAMYYAKNGRTGQIEFSGTDAATVIQSAIVALAERGGKIFIKAGTYERKDNIFVGSKIHIQGEGKQTILKLADYTSLTQTRGVIREANKNVSYPLESEIILSDFVLDVNKANQTITTETANYPYCYGGIVLWGVQKCIVERVEVKNAFWVGIALYPMNQSPYPPLESIVRDCYVTDCGNGNDDTHCGIYVSDGTARERRSLVEGNIVKSCNKNGIVVEDGHGTIVAHNICAENSVYGLAVINSRGVVVIGNDLYLNTTAGFYGYESNYCSVIGNKARENGYGLYYTGFHDCLVALNNCFWNDECGIYHKGRKTNVIGNNCIGNGAGSAPTNPYGIYLAAGFDLIVAGNQCTNDGTFYKVLNSQTYGIFIDPAIGTRICIENNLLFGNATAGLSGSAEIISHNIGYVTENEGVATFSGDGSTTVFNIAHGLVGTPTKYGVSPLTPDADADRTITADATNIIVTFSVAPPTGTDNVKFGWWAKL